MSTTTGAREHVRRVEPPAEAGLDDGGVDAAVGELRERGRGQRLELGRAEPLGRRADAGDRALEPARRRCRAARASRTRAGDVYAPTRSPSAREQRRGHPRRRRLAVRADDVDRREASAAGRRARRAARASGRARTPPATARAPRPSQSPRCIELAAVALELLALGLRRPRRGAFATKRSFASIPSARAISVAQPLALGLDVAVRPARAPGFTTASKIRFSSPSSGTSTPLRRKIAAASCTRVERARVGRRRRRSGHGATISRVSRAGQVRPDLLGHVRHRRVEQLQQPLERGERGRLRVGVAVVEPRLDRLGVPVAEVVEGRGGRGRSTRAEKSNSAR